VEQAFRPELSSGAIGLAPEVPQRLKPALGTFINAALKRCSTQSALPFFMTLVIPAVAYFIAAAENGF
jgi:hypothetical protein